MEHTCDQDTALKFYGLGQQAQFGDNNTEEPHFWEIRDHLKWAAWNDEKGRSRQEARDQFVEMAIPLLLAVGFDPEDPMKEIIT